MDVVKAVENAIASQDIKFLPSAFRSPRDNWLEKRSTRGASIYERNMRPQNRRHGSTKLLRASLVLEYLFCNPLNNIQGGWRSEWLVQLLQLSNHVFGVLKEVTGARQHTKI